jgi:hypothetical protein
MKSPSDAELFPVFSNVLPSRYSTDQVLSTEMSKSVSAADVLEEKIIIIIDNSNKTFKDETVVLRVIGLYSTRTTV